MYFQSLVSYSACKIYIGVLLFIFCQDKKTSREHTV